MRQGGWPRLVFVGLLTGLLAGCFGEEPCTGSDCDVAEEPPPEAPHWLEGARLVGLNASMHVVDAVAETSLTLHIDGPPPAEAHPVIVRVPLPPSAEPTGFAMASPQAAWHAEFWDLRGGIPSVSQGDIQAFHLGTQEAYVAFDASLLPVTVDVAYAHVVELREGRRDTFLDLTGVPWEDVVPVDASLRVESRNGIEDLTLTARAGGMDAASAPGTWEGAPDAPDRPPTHARQDAALTVPGPLDGLRIQWTETDQRLSVAMVCAAAPGTEPVDGLFLLRAQENETLPFDTVFVVDTSGSMGAEGRIVAAREALSAALAALPADARYDIVTFASEAEPFHDQLWTGDRAPDSARVQRLAAQGGTNLDDGLQSGLSILGDGDATRRVAQVVLITDGFPSAGVTDPDEILERYEASDLRGAALHVLAVALPAEESVLWPLVEESGGTLATVRAGDPRVVERTTDFLLGRLAPVWQDVRLQVGGFEHPRRFQEGRTMGADTTLVVSFGDVWEQGPAALHVEAVTPSGRITSDHVFPRETCTVHPAAGPLAGRTEVQALAALEGSEDEAATENITQRMVAMALRTHTVSQHTGWALHDERGQAIRPAGLPAPPPTTQPAADTSAAGLALVAALLISAAHTVRRRARADGRGA